jgi:hypothetical protein
VTKKVTEFVSEHFIFTEEMKKSTVAIIAANTEILKQAELFKTAEAAVSNWGKSQVEVAENGVKKLQDAIKEQNAALYQAELVLSANRKGLHDLTEAEKADWENRLVIANATLKALNEQLIKAQLDEVKAIAEHQVKVINLHKATLEAVLNLQEQEQKAEVEVSANTEKEKAAIEEEFIQKRYETRRKALLQERSIASQLQDKDKVAELNAALAKLDEERTQHYFEQLEKQKEKFKETLDAIAKEAHSVKIDIPSIELPETARRILAVGEAAATAGVTLRRDLVSGLDRAKQALKEYTDAGGKDAAELKQFNANITAAEKNLDNFGKSMDKLKLKGETTFRALVQDLKQGISVTHELSAAGIAAFDQLSASLQSAVASAILGQANFGKALEQATAQALAQLAAQALVKALFYTAEGFAALAGFAYGPAGQYFQAAGIMGAVGAAAGLSAAALNGAGGGDSGGGSYGQTNSNVSNTNSQAGGRQTTVAVQKFADGGLVSAPTLAVIGEDTAKSGPEVVAGLNDKETWQKISKAIEPHVRGAGGGITVNVKGLISADHLSKVVGQINRRVSKGQVHLNSSSTFRITRRSS